MNGYQAYVMYLALKQHFTSDSYDYHKYNGKVRASLDSYESRHDKYYFQKLAKMHNTEKHLVGNLAYNPGLWIGDLLEDDAIKRGKYFQRMTESLSYIFKEDLKALEQDFAENFLVQGNKYPRLLDLYLTGQVTIATMVVLEKCTKYISRWDKKIADPIFWPEIKKKILKISGFFSIDEHKYMTIVKEHFANSQ